MPLAAVRPVSTLGAVILVECGKLTPSSGQLVTVRVEGQELTAAVIASPDQIIGSAALASAGILVRIHWSPGRDQARIAEEALRNHPAAVLPGLGQAVRAGGVSGRVIGLDVPRALVKVLLVTGETLEVAAEDVVVVS